VKTTIKIKKKTLLRLPEKQSRGDKIKKIKEANLKQQGSKKPEKDVNSINNTTMLSCLGAIRKVELS